MPSTRKKAKSSDIAGNRNFLVVGIGASAGGIKALKEFFAAMPADSGMAFVVILHLSQTHKSNLSEIIQRETAMPVEQVTETVKVEPNRVYVIPPAKHLEMVDGVIRSREPERIKGLRVPIDRFFRTLADAYGRSAVCIILSGTGTDGTVGMKHIKGRDGFAMIQDPADAEHDGMPRSAIETGIADVVLPVAEMPEKLLFVRRSTAKFRLTDGKDGEVAKEIKNIELLRDVLTVLRVRTGHDFANYKRPTLVRRVARHLQIHETDDLEVYLKILRDRPDEVLSLLKNLLINVTNFFRDKEAFAMLERKVVPALFEGKTAADQVRVWIAGCASGEEAYSIAILLSEYAATLPDPPKIQVFASDVDEDAITEAREGRFTEAVVSDVSPERLRQFFIRDEDGSYRIRKAIREMILFAPHNILRDPPFSRLDLISCRNVLIYLNRDTQEKILQVFHFALRDGGFLFLGSSESAETMANNFSAIDKKHRIYQSRPSSRNFNTPLALPMTGAWTPRFRQISAETKQNLLSFGDLHHRLIEHYAPPSVLVNEEGDILHLSENAGRFLRFVGGEPTANILKIIHPALLSDIRAALFTARQENKIVEAKNIRVKLDGEKEKLINLTVRPLQMPEAAALVMFEEADTPATEASVQSIVAGDKAMESVVRRLEDELKRTKDQLRNTIEQYETGTEELKASNEELQAINEELRSASEELETSKEELQSVNEELTTVNHELKDKIEEVSRTNSDLQNLMHSTDIATIFLDRSMKVKRYTPPTTEIFNIISGDLGRPLAHITHRLSPDHFEIDAAEALRTLKTIVREVFSTDGRVFLARIVPYRTVEDHIEGVVLTFIDITTRKQAEEQLRRAAELDAFRVELNDALRPLFDAVEIQAVVTKIVMDYFGADRCYYCEIEDDKAIIRRDASSENLPSVAGIYPLEKFPFFKAMMNKGVPLVVENSNTTNLMDEELKQLCLQMKIISFINVPLIKSSQYVGNLCITRSVPRSWTNLEIKLTEEIAERTWAAVERARTQEALRESEERLQQLIKNLPGGVAFALDRDLRYLLAEGEALAAAGIAPQDLVGKTIFEALPEEIAVSYEPFFRKALAGETFTHEHEAHGRCYISRGTPLRSANGEIYAVLAVSYDITERKKSEEALHESEERLRTATEAAQMYTWEFDVESGAYKFSENAPKILGVAPERLPQTVEDAYALVHPDDLEIIERELRQALKTGKGFRAEIRSLKETGEIVWLNVETAVVKDGGRKPSRVIGIAQDITTRRQAEDAVRESEERLRLILESVEDYAIITIDAAGIVSGWNAGAEKTFGWKSSEIIGKSSEILFTPEDRARNVPQKEMKTALQKGRAEDERFHIRKNGTRFYASGVLALFKDGIRGFVKIARDMTDEIKAQKIFNEREMLRKLVGAQEDERKRIARDLHDELGQQLTALRLKLENVRELCNDNSELCAKIDNMQIIAKSIDDGVDFLAWELRPAALDDLGLYAALNKYVREWSHYTGVPAQLLSSRIKNVRLTPETEINLYRIAQEALNNIHKHAEAKEVQIQLKKRGEIVVLIIEDDGRGFDPQAQITPDKGIGLIGMNERAQLVGGTLEIESAPGGGTTVFVRVPIIPDLTEMN